jgi:hypothetical protein
MEEDNPDKAFLSLLSDLATKVELKDHVCLDPL